MDIEITLKGYRCFGHEPGATFTLKPGVTAFLGMNNAGKSTVLRSFFELRKAWRKWCSWEIVSLAGKGVADPGWSLCDVEEYRRFVTDGGSGVLEASVVLPGEICCEGRLGRRIRLTYRHSAVNRIEVRINHGGRDIGWERVDQPGDVLISKAMDRLFPIGRLNEVGSELADTLYIPAFRHPLNAPLGARLFDSVVGAEFLEEWERLYAADDRDKATLARQVQEDVRELLRLNEFRVIRAVGKRNLRVTVDGQSFAQDEVGSGFWHVFMMVALAAIRRPRYVLIDEPESGLHPALQVSLVRVLERHATCGVVMATHNVGLARAVSENVYVVRREGGQSRAVPFGEAARLAELIGEMSYGAYAAIGFHRVLLVEGVTEVKLFQQWLRALGREHGVIIVPLGGSGMIRPDREDELRELTKVTKDVYAVIDSERASADDALESGREAFRQSCEKVGIRCCVTKRRSSDCYLTEAAIRRVKGEKYSALGDFGTLKGHQMGWAKWENWKIASYMTADDLKDTDIGKFLASL